MQFSEALKICFSRCDFSGTPVLLGLQCVLCCEPSLGPSVHDEDRENGTFCNYQGVFNPTILYYEEQLAFYPLHGAPKNSGENSKMFSNFKFLQQRTEQKQFL